MASGKRRISRDGGGERAIDTGLLNALIYRFTADKGKAVEQIVYWELQRRQFQVFFMLYL